MMFDYYVLSQEKSLECLNTFRPKRQRIMPSFMECLECILDGYLTFLNFPQDDRGNHSHYTQPLSLSD
jgi:hypothetical protein